MRVHPAKVRLPTTTTISEFWGRRFRVWKQIGVSLSTDRDEVARFSGQAAQFLLLSSSFSGNLSSSWPFVVVVVVGEQQAGFGASDCKQHPLADRFRHEFAGRERRAGCGTFAGTTAVVVGVFRGLTQVPAHISHTENSHILDLAAYQHGTRSSVQSCWKKAAREYRTARSTFNSGKTDSHHQSAE